MSDIDTGTSQRDVDKIIDEALKAWEKCGFKDMSLWETFQEDFDGFTEEDFRLASDYNIHRLRDYLRKFGVWIRKEQRFTIARSLYEALLEEEPTEWTEIEIMACLDEEEFASYQISWRLEFGFGRKPQLSLFHPTYPSGPRPAATSSAFPALVNAPTTLLSTTLFIPAPTAPTDTRPIPTVRPIMSAASLVDPPPAMTTTSTGNTPTSPLRPPAAVNLSVPAPFVSSSASPIPLGEASVCTSSASPTPAPVNSPIYPTQLSGTRPTPAAYMKPSGPTSGAYLQPPGIGSTTVAYTHPSGKGPPPAAYTAPTVKNLPSAINPPVATGTGHGRELSNLVKIYTNDAKYSGHNDSFTFKLAILHDICSRADLPPEAKMKGFPTMLKGPALDKYPSNIGISGTVINSDQVRYSVRRKWIKWDKTQNEMDETIIGVG